MAPSTRPKARPSMDRMEADEDRDHRQHVGNTLMGFSTLGLMLGGMMMMRGAGGEGFLDGPSTLAIGAVTLAVGIGLRRSGRTIR